MNHDEQPPQSLIHVHQCSSCGRFSLPEQFSARETVRGLYECPFCHLSEPLNVRVVSRSKLEGQS
jgi:hypothetical protein